VGVSHDEKRTVRFLTAATSYNLSRSYPDFESDNRLHRSSSGFLLRTYGGGAYNSLKVIATEIPNGWLVQRLHNIAGNGLSLSLVEIVVMFWESDFAGAG